MTDETTIVLNEPITHSLLDDADRPTVGRSISRIEGPLKVAGAARYAAEHSFPDMVYGVFVQAPFGG